MFQEYFKVDVVCGLKIKQHNDFGFFFCHDNAVAPVYASVSDISLVLMEQREAFSNPARAVLRLKMIFRQY